MSMDKYDKKEVKKGMSLTDIANTPEFQEAYEQNRGVLGMKALKDRPILVTDWKIATEENIKGKEVEMVTFDYVLLDDPDRVPHYQRTESSPIRDILKSIPDKSKVVAAGGFTTMIISKTNLQGGQTYYFSF